MISRDVVFDEEREWDFGSGADEVFAFVARLETIRLIISLAA